MTNEVIIGKEKNPYIKEALNHLSAFFNEKITDNIRNWNITIYNDLVVATTNKGRDYSLIFDENLRYLEKEGKVYKEFCQ